jgi:hypothetical protein
MEQSAAPPFNQAPRSFFVIMPKLTTKAAGLQWEPPRLPKDVSLLPKSAKCAGRNAEIVPKSPATTATRHVKYLAITV